MRTPIYLIFPNLLLFAGFEVLPPAVMKFNIFWDIVPCSPYMSLCFGGTYHLHLQGRKSAKQETTCSCWFLARLIFNPEDGGDMFLRNISSYMDYMALYPRIWKMFIITSLLGPNFLLSPSFSKTLNPYCRPSCGHSRKLAAACKTLCWSS
jgi:hypothetical protein